MNLAKWIKLKKTKAIRKYIQNTYSKLEWADQFNQYIQIRLQAKVPKGGQNERGWIIWQKTSKNLKLATVLNKVNWKAI